MKTNVSIKFNSIEEYREIEKKLIELGYVNDKEWNDLMIRDFKFYNNLYVNYGGSLFCILSIAVEVNVYNSLQEFLNDK